MKVLVRSVVSIGNHSKKDPSTKRSAPKAQDHFKKPGAAKAGFKLDKYWPEQMDIFDPTHKMKIGTLYMDDGRLELKAFNKGDEGKIKKLLKDLGYKGKMPS